MDEKIRKDIDNIVWLVTIRKWCDNFRNEMLHKIINNYYVFFL